MLDPARVAEHTLPPPAVALTLPGGGETRSTTFQRLAALAEAFANRRARLREQSQLFDQLYRTAEQIETSAEEIEQTAKIIHDKEREAAAVIVPQIEKLERNLAKRRPVRAARRAVEEALDIGTTWLELYQNLQIRLLKLASDRRAAAGEAGSTILSDATEMEQHLRRLAGE